MSNQLNYLHDTRNASGGGGAGVSYGRVSSTDGLGNTTINSLNWEKGIIFLMQTRFETVARSQTTSISTSKYPTGLTFTFPNSLANYVRCYSFTSGGATTLSFALENDIQPRKLTDGVGLASGSGISLQSGTVARPLGFGISFNSSYRINYTTNNLNIENSLVVRPTKICIGTNGPITGDTLNYQVWGYNTNTLNIASEMTLIGSGVYTFTTSQYTNYISLSSSKYFSNIEFRAVGGNANATVWQTEVYGSYKLVKYKGV